MQFANIKEFREYLATLPPKLEAAKAEGLQAAGDIILKEIHSEVGEYQGGDAGFEDWEPLSPITIANKEAAGQGVPNPLEATDAMGESFGVQVDGDSAVIGTADMVAVYQNEGTRAKGIRFKAGISVEPGIPEREFIGRAAFRKAPEAIDAIAFPIVTVLSGGAAPKGRF